MTTARDLVTDRIAQRARRFPDFDLTPLDVSPLESRDAALAKAIDHVVARHWLTLAAICDAKLAQSWSALESVVQAPLLVGAAQLLFLDRVPDHAIVSEAVAWTKRHARAKAGGLVNAVLRRVAELRDQHVESARPPLDRITLPLHDGRGWRLREPVFSENPLLRLAQQTSHPDEALNRWSIAYGERMMTDLALHSLVHPPIIVTGLRTTTDEPQLVPHEETGFFVFTGPREELDGLLARQSGARVQDPATARAISSMAFELPVPHRIIDLCAGRGTKTRQLAELFPSARLIATDIDADRVSVLAEVAQRSAGRIEAVEFAGIRQFDGQADLLVIDAPCSNSGVFARRVEAKYRLTKAQLDRVAAMQRQILADAIPLLAPQGSILYITCSIEREENEQQAAWLSKWHGLTFVHENRLMPRGLPGEAPTSYADGGYAVLLRRM